MAVKVSIEDLMWENRIRSISELSRKSHVSRPTLYKWISGDVDRIELDVLDKLCDALKCEPQDIIKIEKEIS